MASVHRRRNDKNEKDSTGLLKELPRACTDEVAALEFMEKLRWGDSPACPRCGDTDVYQMRDRATRERSKRFLWRCNGCGEQYTVRIGTVFEDSRIALRYWCFAFWAACASKKGVSALQIRRQTGVSYKSALFMMHRIRYAMAPDAPKAPKLTGTVEVDETWVGGKPRPRTRREWARLRKEVLSRGGRRVPNARSNKTPVMAMVERGGEVRAQVIADVTARNVGEVLLANVSADAHLRTDEGGHYRRIGRRFASHEEVKHGLHQYVKGDASVNAAESFFARLKRTLYGTHHAVSRRHLHRYVAEVAFKHNTRKLDDGQRIIAAIRAADGKRLTYRAPVIASGA
jgi:transposase-like protein